MKRISKLTALTLLVLWMPNLTEALQCYVCENCAPGDELTQSLISCNENNGNGTEILETPGLTPTSSSSSSSSESDSDSDDSDESEEDRRSSLHLVASSKLLSRQQQAACYSLRFKVNDTQELISRGCTTAINGSTLLTCKSLEGNRTLEDCKICQKDGCNKIDSMFGQNANGVEYIKITNYCTLAFILSILMAIN